MTHREKKDTNLKVFNVYHTDKYLLHVQIISEEQDLRPPKINSTFNVIFKIPNIRGRVKKFNKCYDFHTNTVSI